ncbi:MAG: hypothetical protein RLZZ463_1361 [Bacteroidota bacterium]
MKYRWWLLLLWMCAVRGQDTTEVRQVDLSEITLWAPKSSESLLLSPLALQRIDLAQVLSRSSAQNLNDALRGVPGVWAQNAVNMNQDLRISIRGFGARGAFGIRGVKIILDGVPETTPDGSGQVDHIPQVLLSAVDVLRGPQGAWMGSSASGALVMRTRDDLGGARLELDGRIGANGYQQFTALGQINHRQGHSLWMANRQSAQGYRDHSQYQSQSALYKRIWGSKAQGEWRWTSLFFYSPHAQDPGGLTEAQWLESPRQARAANVDFQVDESVTHVQSALHWRQTNGSRTSNAFAYLSYRDFASLLPYTSGGGTSFTRWYGGVGYQATDRKTWGLLGWGASHQNQTDQRQRYDNVNGQPGASLSDQKEAYAESAVFGHVSRTLGDFTGAGSLRVSRVSMGVDPSMSVHYPVTPALSVQWNKPKNWMLYTLWGSSFDTPTLNELSQNPYGPSGFNPDLGPSTYRSLDIGAKSTRIGQPWSVALYRIWGDSELTPYSLPGQNERTFFRNRGASTRMGAELSWKKTWGPWTWSHSAQWQKTEIDPVTSSDFKHLPGVPEHQYWMALAKDWGGWILHWEHLWAGGVYVSTNTDKKTSANYQSHLGIAKTWTREEGTIRWTAGVNNLWNAALLDQVRVNAFGGRYFDPAPGRTVFMGLNYKR